MHHLLLLRHGQAAAESAAGGDIERPLVERGASDAAAVGEWLRHAELPVDLVLCSPARRAGQTWENVAKAWAASVSPPPVTVAERIYRAEADTLLELVRETGEAVRGVLLVGHNPAVHRLAFDLTGADAVREGFPAAALATIYHPGHWVGLVPGSGTLEAFV